MIITIADAAIQPYPKTGAEGDGSKRNMITPKPISERQVRV